VKANILEAAGFQEADREENNRNLEGESIYEHPYLRIVLAFIQGYSWLFIKNKYIFCITLQHLILFYMVCVAAVGESSCVLAEERLLQRD